MKSKIILTVLLIFSTFIYAHNEFFTVWETVESLRAWSSQNGVVRQDIVDKVYPGLLRRQDFFSDHA